MYFNNLGTKLLGRLPYRNVFVNCRQQMVRGFIDGPSSSKDYRRRTVLNYAISIGVVMLGLGYAGVPLYRLFCSKTGFGMNTELARAKSSLIGTMKPVKNRKVVVRFSADTYSNMPWKFKPLQSELVVVPGETALAFYTASNPTDKPIVGIATYTVVPGEAAKYFNKIQCFCFEEQRLNPHEEVDMPVFFFLDPEFDEDPRLMRVNNILLHYTFFEAKKDKFNIPGITTQRPEVPSTNPSPTVTVS